MVGRRKRNRIESKISWAGGLLCLWIASACGGSGSTGLITSEPTNPVPPGPVDPVEPIEPIDPIEPVDPIAPIEPVDPILPIEPIDPILPVEPIDPGEIPEPGPLVSDEDRVLEQVRDNGGCQELSLTTFCPSSEADWDLWFEYNEPADIPVSPAPPGGVYCLRNDPCRLIEEALFVFFTDFLTEGEVCSVAVRSEGENWLLQTPELVVREAPIILFPLFAPQAAPYTRPYETALLCFASEPRTLPYEIPSLVDASPDLVLVGPVIIP